MVLSIMPLTGIISSAEEPFSTKPMISAGVDYTLALKSNGTIWAWGDNEYSQIGDGTIINRWFPFQVKNLTDVISVSAGFDHSVALKVTVLFGLGALIFLES